jgi:hypothetical protein
VWFEVVGLTGALGGVSEVEQLGRVQEFMGGDGVGNWS